ncbi:MAG: ATP synthase F1 subunit gamma [Ignavibacteria bacterium]|jgi:F-type H+-transporting ATPase subunit gamma|nr:ATP synthase F1 subunit gamma [Ignavibacteria bacterium]MDH7526767.1 ATP synthase F1 subunit gamma [Ignavibacteria bacterium]
MATLREIRRRIIGIKSTQQITKAMKMVAAAKLRRAQEAILNFRPYANTISNLLDNFVSNINDYNNPLLHPREVNRVTVVVVTSDRGLCGSFNTNLLRYAEDFIKTELKSYLDTKNLDIVCIGKKGNDYFTKRNYPVKKGYVNFFANLNYENALGVIHFLVNEYLIGNTDKVVFIYNEFRSVISQVVKQVQILPIVVEKKEETNQEKYKPIIEFIYEPTKEKILDTLLPKYLEVQMWRIILESNASEQGARMTAMDNATENAKELLKILSLSYNRARQAAITKELLEIVAGADALKEQG